MRQSWSKSSTNRKWLTAVKCGTTTKFFMNNNHFKLNIVLDFVCAFFLAALLRHSIRNLSAVIFWWRWIEQMFAKDYIVLDNIHFKFVSHLNIWTELNWFNAHAWTMSSCILWRWWAWLSIFTSNVYLIFESIRKDFWLERFRRKLLV